MTVVAVNHLLEIVGIVAFVSDLLRVADPVADGGNGAGDWHDVLSISPDSCHPLRHPVDDAVARPNLPVTMWESDNPAMFMVLGCANETGSRHPAQDAPRPG